MREELDNQLCREFPNLYRQRHSDARQTAMCWGFQCGDGWFQLLYDISKELELEIIKYKAKYGEEAAESMCASTVKEKFGTLRFYLHGGTEKMHWLADIAETRSCYTCEECGSEEGINASDGWVRTLCLEHWNMHLAEKTVDAVYYNAKIGTKTKTYGENEGKEYAAVVLEDRDQMVQRASSWQRLMVELSSRERWSFWPRWYRYSEHKGLRGYVENAFGSLKSKLSYLKYKWWWKRIPESLARWARFKLFRLERRVLGKRIR